MAMTSVPSLFFARARRKSRQGFKIERGYLEKTVLLQTLGLEDQQKILGNKVLEITNAGSLKQHEKDFWQQQVLSYFAREEKGPSRGKTDRKPELSQQVIITIWLGAERQLTCFQHLLLSSHGYTYKHCFSDSCYLRCLIFYRYYHPHFTNKELEVYKAVCD